MKSLALAALLALSMPSTGAAAANKADEDAVRQAVLDYVEGVYNVDPSRIERSVHPRLAKIGFYRSAADPTYRGATE